jgi:hypothetical protein
VTSAGGSADIVADNASKKIDVTTGEADASNASGTQVGLTWTGNFDEVFGSDASSTGFVYNQQDGDNSASLDQTSDATTGDGVAGQVIGAVSAGDTSIDAKNRSEKVDVDTGDATADNAAATQVGLTWTGNFDEVFGTDATLGSGGYNQQDGDNEAAVSQTSDASSGDGVGGQVIGAVTSAGGSADIASDNGSKKVDVTTGDADASNAAGIQVGLTWTGNFDQVFGSDAISSSFVDNQQDGDNAAVLDQTSDATTGDGVAGQVIGTVSAGDTSIDAKNRSEKVDLQTGDATADNAAAAEVGLTKTGTSNQVSGVSDATSSGGSFNQQDGDNEADLSQTADASSGDAVAGQVAGVVTSAGGSADLVLDNGSKKVDAESGPSEFSNEQSLFVGLNFSGDELIVG